MRLCRDRSEQAAARERFLQLTVYDVLAVMDKVSNYTGERIRNMHKYILTALYWEPVTRQSTVAQQVAYDMCGGLDSLRGQHPLPLCHGKAAKLPGIEGFSS